MYSFVVWGRANGAITRHSEGTLSLVRSRIGPFRDGLAIGRSSAAVPLHPALRAFVVADHRIGVEPIMLRERIRPGGLRNCSGRAASGTV